MSESLSDAVREAAYHRTIHEPAEGLWEDLCEVGCSESAAFRAGFIEGAVWAAERLPTEAELTNAILGRTAPSAAKAVLALIREHITKEENDNT